jgi:hypothetical protein
MDQENIALLNKSFDAETNITLLRTILRTNLIDITSPLVIGSPSLSGHFIFSSDQLGFDSMFSNIALILNCNHKNINIYTYLSKYKSEVNK